MIVTEIYNGQGLGNQLWCYVVTRTIATSRNLKFGIMNPHKFKCLDFMNLDFGESVYGGSSPYEGAPPTVLPDGINNYYAEKPIVHPVFTNSDVRIHDFNLVNVPDNSKIDGCMQDEQYILHKKEEIKKWLKVKDEHNCIEFSSDDICVMNFRGGEYVGLHESFLRPSYWHNAMQHMKNINSNMQFVVITDDVLTAKQFFPTLPVYHFSIGKDYSIINNAKYLILSNSSFAWFPAWTNEQVKFCIAPKYWGKHNISDGFWSLGYACTKGSGWMYQTREGNLENYDKCLAECNEYILKNKYIYE